MSFGLLVSDYTIQTGTYGKTIKIDISDYLPYSIDLVQGESSTNVKSAVVTGGVELSVLQGYIEDSSCPDIAYSYNADTLTIFFKNDTYDTRFAFAGLRSPQKMALTTDYWDGNEDDMTLLESYILEQIYSEKGLTIPYRTRKDIKDREVELKNEV